MKKYIAFMGGAMFFVICMSLYLMLESSSLPNGRGYIDNDVNNIEAKIKDIEVHLQRNHQTINLIKDAVKDIADGDKSAIKRLEKVLNMGVEKGPLKFSPMKTPLFNQTKVSYPAEVCSLGNAPAAKTDIQMMDVFDSLPFDNPDGGAWKQGWDVQYSAQSFDKDKLKVFVVPHSHNDPGWIKTFEQYYTSQTRLILDSMLEKLQAYPKMRFIYAEMSFFSMWWGEISSKKREIVKKLIAEKRLELVTAGWVMTDEANAHYFAMLDQLIEGNQWLLDNVGVSPQNGWAIDPFGQSPTMAYLLQGASFDNMLIQRVHYSVKKYLAKTKQLEFLWRQNWDQDGKTDMFCHMMPFYSYDVPHTCGPDPKVCCQFDFKRLPGGRINCPWKVPPQEIHDGNVAQRAEILLDQYRKKAQLYKNNIVLAPLGDDFRYDKNTEWDQQYNNYQKLFDYMNSKPELKVEARFGTLSDYFNAVHERAGMDAETQLPKGYPVLSGDFFTYSDRDDHYWSGYYTSRPFYKRLDRVMESHLRGGEILYSIAVVKARQHSIWNFPEKALMRSITNARRNLGLYQHHDGITGTAKDHVVMDYGSKLLQSINDMRKVIADSTQFLLTFKQGKYDHDDGTFFDLDEQRSNHDEIPQKVPISVTKIPKNVVFYNSLAHHRQAIVHLHVSESSISVKNSEGKVIPSQVDPYWISQNDISEARFRLSFMVSVSGIGLHTYTMQKVPEGENKLNSIASVHVYNTNGGIKSALPFKVEEKVDTEIKLENSFFEAILSSETGSLSSVTNKLTKRKTKTEVQFLIYGTTSKRDKSGAYLFMPDGPARPVPIMKPYMRVIQGPILSEVQSFLPNVEHTSKIYNTPSLEGQGIRLENVVDIRDQINKELVMRIVSDVNNHDKEWFSDLNGFQIQRRQTYSKIPLQGNFYPMPTMAYIQDSNTRLSLLSGQSLGTSSLEPGWLEVVQDRRLNQDDNRGLAQGVTDNKRTPNIFTMLIEPYNPPSSTVKQNMGYPSLLAHLSSLELIHPVFILPKHNDFSKDLSPYLQPLAQPLPCDIHLLNVRTLEKKSVAGSNMPDLHTAVLFHRLGVDCKVPSSGISCQAPFGKVNLDKLFDGMSWKDLYATSFNLIHDSGEITLRDDFVIPLMEIRAFKGHLH